MLSVAWSLYTHGSYLLLTRTYPEWGVADEYHERIVFYCNDVSDRYRVKRPDMDRPFNIIPCGSVGGGLVALPVVIASVATLYFSSVSDGDDLRSWAMGVDGVNCSGVSYKDNLVCVDGANMIAASLFVLAGFVVNVLYIAFLRLQHWHRRQHRYVVCDDNKALLLSHNGMHNTYVYNGYGSVPTSDTDSEDGESHAHS
eukprot:m.38037 g.38037  ORF g.38037 m.38037 type:complete len:199 (+) comp5610_c0_seq2:1315-1911(+)